VKNSKEDEFPKTPCPAHLRCQEERFSIGIKEPLKRGLVKLCNHPYLAHKIPKKHTTDTESEQNVFRRRTKIVHLGDAHSAECAKIALVVIKITIFEGGAQR
jgi:hypothetical protein